MSIMRRLMNWPIQRKLLLIILMAVGVSLVLVLLGIFAYELTSYRKRLSQDMKNLGGFIAANSAPTLAFDDAPAAQEILNTLNTSPAVAVAVLYTPAGQVFAAYLRPDLRSEALPPMPLKAGVRFAWVGGRLELVRKVQKKERWLGTLYLRADPANLHQRLTDYVGIFAVVSLAIAGGAYLLQSLLRRLVSDPLLRLAGTAETIAGGDLSIQVPVQSNDEMGQLAAAFNHMTSQLAHSYELLKEREERLRRAKDELEVRVLERTQELELTYQKLHLETEERLTAIQNLRQNEQLLLQQSRLAAMGEMLGNIAHQWRQPLNNLGLILQDMSMNYALGTLQEEDMQDAVGRAMDLILHMSRTVDDFRSFLQPEKEKTLFDVNRAVTATISLLEATLKAMQVDIQVRETGQLFIEGRRNEFAQVIMNLITNARDVFKERGVRSPKLVIGLFREGSRCVVTFSDNAGGIPDDIIDRIFDPYFTTKGPDKGTGIGLFMSKTIIEKSMHGTLTVRNTASGAEFRIEVAAGTPPLAEAAG